MELLEECHTKAVKLLEENRDVLDKIAAYLAEKETITGKQFMELYEQTVAARTAGSSDRVAEDVKTAEAVSDAGSAAVPESAVSDTAETTEKEVSEAPEQKTE